jgi:hypothetical protein
MSESIEKFLETNYINPIIKSFTRKITAPDALKKDFKCGGKCGGEFYYDDLKPWKYAGNKRILLCEKCYNKRQRKR